MVAHCVRCVGRDTYAASFTSVSPPAVHLRAGQTVSVGGVGFVNVQASDASAVVVAASCSTPTASQPTVAAVVTSTFVSATAVQLSVNASSSRAGVYRLCARWGVNELYADVGQLQFGEWAAAFSACAA